MDKIYLDHNATTQLHPEVFDAILPYLRDRFGNPSSIHWAGSECKSAVDDARENIAKLFNAQVSEVVFTSSGSESDNMAIKGAFEAKRKEGNHIITTKVEHPAVLETCRYLEKEGARVTYLSVNKDGMLDLKELHNSITKDTVLITIMFANNETGTIFPIREIGEMAKKNNILFHCDAVQAVAKIPIDFNSMNIDLLSLSGHKIYAPKGVGALLIRKGVRIKALIHGGHQEKNRRAGTENVPGIVGLGKACEVALRDMERESSYLIKLRERLHQGIVKNIEHVRLNGHPSQRLPNTLNISFMYIEGESILLNLDMKGVAASSGSACTSGTLDPSHVLMAMGLTHEEAHGSVRFSLGRINKEEEIDYVISILPPIVERLRSFSPLYSKKSTDAQKVNGQNNNKKGVDSFSSTNM